MEGSVNVRALSSTVITSDNDEIKRISDTLEVILLELCEESIFSVQVKKILE